MKKIKLLTLLFTALLVSGSVWGATITVGTSGADYTTIQDAITNASAGDEIKLVTEIDFGQPATQIMWTIDKNLTINMNGQTLKGNGKAANNSDAKIFNVQSGVTLTMIGAGTFDLSVTKNYGYHFYNNGGTVIVDPGQGNNLYFKKGYYFYYGSGTKSFKGGYYNSNSNLTSYIDQNMYYVDGPTDGWYIIKLLTEICTVNGTAYKKISDAMSAAKVEGVITYPIVLTDNATYSSNVTENYTFDGSAYTLTLTNQYGYFDDGTYNCKVSVPYAIYGGVFNAAVEGALSSKIQGGIFASDPTAKLADNFGTVFRDNKYCVAKTADINNGLIGGKYYQDVNAFVATDYSMLTNSSAPKYYVVPTANVQDGKVFKGIYTILMPSGICASSYSSAYVKDGSSNYRYIMGQNIQVLNYKIVSGQFLDNPTDYVYAQSNVTYENNVWTVAVDPSAYVAAIGETKYITLASAISAVPTTGVETEVKLLKDVTTEGATIAANQNVKFNLQDYALGSASVSTAIMVNAGGVVTIVGSASSSINASSYAISVAAGTYSFDYYSYSYVDINPGSASIPATFEGKINQGVSVGTSSGYGNGTLSVIGGYYNEAAKSSVSKYVAAGYLLAEQTGAYAGYYKVEVLTEANAYVMVETAGGAKSYFADFTSAVPTWQSADNNTLKLLRNTSGYAVLDQNRTLILDMNGDTLTKAGSNIYNAVEVKSGNLTIQSTIDGGSIISEGTAAYAVVGAAGTTIDILSGNFVASYACFKTAGTLNITNCTANSNTYVFLCSSGAYHVNIYGGTYHSDNGMAYYMTSSSGSVLVEGGEFNGEGRFDYRNLTIHGGTFNEIYNYDANTSTTITGGLFRYNINPNFKFSISGGEFVNQPLATQLAPGYESYQMSNNHYGIRLAAPDTNPFIIYLKNESTDPYKLTGDEDIRSYGSNIVIAGNKTVDLNGHSVQVPHNLISVTGTLTLNNSSATQASFSESDATIDGYARELGGVLDIRENATLNINGDINMYGNTNALLIRDNAKLNIDGTSLEAKYCAAIALANATQATIKNAHIVSRSSSTVNSPIKVWSYAIRENGQNAMLTIENSTVIGVQGAVGISGANTSATIKNCDLQAHHTPGFTDCHGALYVATNAIVNVWNTKMTSDRDHYSAFIGNNDNTDEWGVINLYEGCLLKDKMYIQQVKPGKDYSFPSQIPLSSVWYQIAAGTAEDQCGPLPEGYKYEAATEDGYNWKVTSGATGAKEVVGTTDIFWDRTPTWSGLEVPVATDLAFVPAGKNVIVRVPEGQESYKAVAQQLTIEAGGTVTVENGATLEIGKSGMNIAEGGKLIVEAQGIATVGSAGALTMNDTALYIKADANGSGCFAIAPAEGADPIYTHPHAKVEMYTKAHHVSGDDYTWQHFGIPTNGAAESIKMSPKATTWINKWENKDWQMISNISEMNTPFRGYNLTNANTEAGTTYTFVGNLVGNGNGVLNFAEKGYNVMGNSFTAPIDIKEVLSGLSDDVQGTIWIYDAENDNHIMSNQFLIKIGDADFTTIAPMQGFIMKLTNGESLEEDYDYKKAVWENANKIGIPLHAPKRAASSATGARIVLTANNHKDEIRLFEDADYTADFDNGADASKYMEKNHFNFYASTANDELSVVVADDLDGTFLTVSADNNNVYEMSFENVNNFNYILKDMQTNREYAIAEGVTYTFAVDANAVNANRFQLVATRKTPTSVVNVTEAVAKKGVYTALGQYVGEAADFNALPNGLYIVNGQRVVK